MVVIHHHYRRRLHSLLAVWSLQLFSFLVSAEESQRQEQQAHRLLLGDKPGVPDRRQKTQPERRRLKYLAGIASLLRRSFHGSNGSLKSTCGRQVRSLELLVDFGVQRDERNASAFAATSCCGSQMRAPRDVSVTTRLARLTKPKILAVFNLRLNILASTGRFRCAAS